MNRLLFILIAATYTAQAAKLGVTKEHTQIVTDIFEQIGIYIPSTYGGRVQGVDPCTPVANRAAFIRLLDASDLNLEEFNLGEYEMEHIVEEANTPYTQSKKIAGNLVFANSAWNRQVGQLNWTQCAHEKRMVYGAIFDEAIGHVVACGGEDVSYPTATPTTQISGDDDDDDVVIVLLLFSTMLIVGAIGGIMYRVLANHPHSPQTDIETPEPRMDDETRGERELYAAC